MSALVTNAPVYQLRLSVTDPKGEVLIEHYMLTDQLQSVINRIDSAGILLKRLRRDQVKNTET